MSPFQLPPFQLLEAIAAPVAVVTVAEAAALALSPPQREAIFKLTAGYTRVDAARAAGVSRMTLYRWLREDPAFQAAYNAWQSDVLCTAQGQLLAGTRDAVAAVLSAIRLGDTRLAWKLLESQGVTARPQPGSADLAELQRRAEMEQKKQEIAERREQNQVLLDDLATPDEW
jgi:DNA invertase Pin-like site-specific DNA recombinase